MLENEGLVMPEKEAFIAPGIEETSLNTCPLSEQVGPSTVPFENIDSSFVKEIQNRPLIETVPVINEDLSSKVMVPLMDDGLPPKATVQIDDGLSSKAMVHNSSKDLDSLVSMSIKEVKDGFMAIIIQDKKKLSLLTSNGY